MCYGNCQVLTCADLYLKNGDIILNIISVERNNANISQPGSTLSEELHLRHLFLKIRFNTSLVSTFTALGGVDGRAVAQGRGRIKIYEL